MNKHVEVLDFKERLLQAKEWVWMVRDWEWDKKREKAQNELNKANSEYTKAIEQADVIVLISIAYFIVLIILYLRSSLILKVISGGLVSISLVFLYIGIFTPMLEISAYNENLKIPLVINLEDWSAPVEENLNMGVDMLNSWIKDYTGMEIPKNELSKWATGELDLSIVFKGKMYYYYQSKSIASLIHLLFKDKNYIVAWAILSFSVILPLIKLLLTLLITLSTKLRKNKAFIMVIKIIGKWSMADVFVAATFLAYLSFYNMNVGIETSSNVLFGLHFFFTYVIISILASIAIWLEIRKESKIALYEMIA